MDPSFGDGVDIVQWVKSKLQKPDYENAICYLDDEIIYWEEVEQAKVLKLLELAISCTQLACEARPSMREIVKTLIKAG